MKFDDSEFKKRAKELVTKVLPTRQEKALFAGGMAIYRDCFLAYPTVPRREGWLRGSGSVHVNGDLAHESTDGKKGLANTSQIHAPNSVVVGFNAPYAAYVHEGKRGDGSRVIRNWLEPSSGAGFLSKKITMFKKKYISIMAKAMKGQYA
jgi:hypothetical protein